MTYTKKQRRAIYSQAAKLIELKQQRYCCCALEDITGHLFNHDKIFPELYFFHPNVTILSLWWESNDAESRINALLLCNEMCR